MSSASPQRRAYAKRYYQQHRQRILEYYRLRYRTRPEVAAKARLCKQRWKKLHPDKVKEAKARYRLRCRSNPEKVRAAREYRLRWKTLNREKVRQYKIAARHKAKAERFTRDGWDVFRLARFADQVKSMPKPVLPIVGSEEWWTKIERGRFSQAQTYEKDTLVTTKISFRAMVLEAAKSMLRTT